MNTIDPSQNPKIEHRVREFLTALNSSGGKPIETLPPIEARQVLVNVQASVPLTLPACDVEETTIAQDGLEVNLTIVRPAGATAVLPVFLFIHGGGWILGDFPTHERFVRDLVVGSGFTAVFVNYTPSPEAQYPMAINQIYAAARWVAAHGDEIKVDGKRLGIVGNSVGGNMTAAVALMALHKGGPDFKCQAMLWPVTDANFETGSYLEYANGYFLSRAMMQWFWDAYAPATAQRREIYASPLQASTEQLQGIAVESRRIAGLRRPWSTDVAPAHPAQRDLTRGGTLGFVLAAGVGAAHPDDTSAFPDEAAASRGGTFNSNKLQGLPPALVQVAGNDVLHDEGLAYARKLDAAGVDVTVATYENLIHDYGLLNAISQVPAVRDALHQVAEMLKKHLK